MVLFIKLFKEKIIETGNKRFVVKDIWEGREKISVSLEELVL